MYTFETVSWDGERRFTVVVEDKHAFDMALILDTLGKEYHAGPSSDGPINKEQCDLPFGKAMKHWIPAKQSLKTNATRRADAKD